MSENDKTGTVGRTSDPVTKPHTMGEIVPSSVPLTIPYFEVYRTNELEYVEYESPFLNQDDSDTDSDTDSEDDSPEDSEEVKNKKKKLWTELSNRVWQYFPKIGNKDKWIQSLRDADLNWTSVAKVVNRMAKEYKSKHNITITEKQQNYMIEAVLEDKESASGLTRRNYSQSKKLIKKGKQLANSRRGKVFINELNNYNKHDGNDAFAHFLGSKFETISKIKLK